MNGNDDCSKVVVRNEEAHSQDNDDGQYKRMWRWRRQLPALARQDLEGGEAIAVLNLA